MQRYDVPHSKFTTRAHLLLIPNPVACYLVLSPRSHSNNSSLHQARPRLHCRRRFALLATLLVLENAARAGSTRCEDVGAAAQADLRALDKRIPGSLLARWRASRPLLVLRGGDSDDDPSRHEAGVAQALLDPRYVAARGRRHSVGTHVSVGQFPTESSQQLGSARLSKRKRIEMVNAEDSPDLKDTPSDKGDYEKLFGDLHIPDRPAFLERIPDLPQYEPDSEEQRVQDDDVCYLWAYQHLVLHKVTL